jgi:hypothetical protein
MKQQCVRIKKNGARCELSPMHGATVCHKHGGKAPQIIAAARRRREEQTALQWAAQELAQHGYPDRTPLEHLEQVLEEDARAYALWAAACGLLIDEGGDLLGENRHGEQQIHPYVDERNKAATRWARTSKYALDAGVSQKRIEIEQQRAEVIVGAVKAALMLLAREFNLDAAFQQRGVIVIAEMLRNLGPGTVEQAG